MEFVSFSRYRYRVVHDKAANDRQPQIEGNDMQLTLNFDNEPARAWCWGAGWDSTAGIILDVLAGRRIDLITFANHGAEKRRADKRNGEQVGTYEFIGIFSDWLAERGYCRPTVCKYQPKPETAARYRQAAADTVQRLGLTTIDDQDLDRLGNIYGNMLANETMPGQAFGLKSCSFKWKIEAQEPT